MRTQLQEETGFLLIIKNKNNPVGEKQTGKQAGQDTRHTTTNQHRNCKHKEILKGANEEGNEGRQVGKINQ